MSLNKSNTNPLIKQFNIEKPKFQKHYLITIIFKYLVLSFVTWIVIVAIILFYFGSLFRESETPDFVFNLLFIISTIATLFVYLRYFLRKYKLSDIYSIVIDFNKEFVEFKSISKFKDTEIIRKIKFHDFSFEYHLNKHILFGDQRIFTFFDGDKLYNVLNIDLTAWNRLKNIDEVIETILGLKQ